MREEAHRELQHLFGNVPELLLMTLFPCAMVGVLAWLLSSAIIRDLPIAVVDQDRSTLSRDLIRRLDNSAGLSVTKIGGDLQEAFSSVRRMDIYAAVLIPYRSTRHLHHEGGAHVVVYYNASFLTAGQGASRDVAAAVSSINATMVAHEIAKEKGAEVLGGVSPLVLQPTMLANPQRSFEHYLLGLLFPGVLHLMACLGMVSALGREVRDGTLASWIGAAGNPVACLLGRLMPYVVWYGVLLCGGLFYLSVVRGGGIEGSVPMLVVGAFLLPMACAGISLLLVGALRDMGTALSVCGLYVGTALAFSGATFPTYGASLFTRAWNSVLPLTAYLKLQGQQMDLGAPPADSLLWLLALLLFCLLPGLLGMRLMIRQAQVGNAE